MDAESVLEYEIFNTSGECGGAVWRLTRKSCGKRFSRYCT